MSECWLSSSLKLIQTSTEWANGRRFCGQNRLWGGWRPMQHWFLAACLSVLEFVAIICDIGTIVISRRRRVQPGYIWLQWCQPVRQHRWRLHVRLSYWSNAGQWWKNLPPWVVLHLRSLCPLPIPSHHFTTSLSVRLRWPLECVWRSNCQKCSYF